MKIHFAMLAMCLLSAISFLLIALGSPALALSRYECKGLASDTIILTPYQDGSVNLSFDKGPVQATAKFAQQADMCGTKRHVCSTP